MGLRSRFFDPCRGGLEKGARFNKLKHCLQGLCEVWLTKVLRQKRSREPPGNDSASKSDTKARSLSLRAGFFFCTQSVQAGRLIPSGHRDPNDGLGLDLGENVASSSISIVLCDLCSESRDCLCGFHLSTDDRNGLHCHSIDDSRGGSGRRRVADFLHSTCCDFAAGHVDPAVESGPALDAGHPPDAGHLAEQ